MLVMPVTLAVHCYTGVLAYADDVVLLAPSASATRKMLAL